MHLVGFTIEIKRMHYMENKSICRFVIPFVNQSVYLSASLSVDAESSTKMTYLQECRLWKFFTKSCRTNASFMNISRVKGVLYYR